MLPFLALGFCDVYTCHISCAVYALSEVALETSNRITRRGDQEDPRPFIRNSSGSYQNSLLEAKDFSPQSFFLPSKARSVYGR